MKAVLNLQVEETAEIERPLVPLDRPLRVIKSSDVGKKIARQNLAWTVRIKRFEDGQGLEENRQLCAEAR